MTMSPLTAPESHGDDLAQVGFGEHANALSGLASQTALLLRRLSTGIAAREDVRLAGLTARARQLVTELKDARDHAHEPDRDLGVRQLIPVKVYRHVVEGHDNFQDLADRLEQVLKTELPLPDKAQLRALADAVDDFNFTLQRQADQAIASLDVVH